MNIRLVGWYSVRYNHGEPRRIIVSPYELVGHRRKAETGAYENSFKRIEIFPTLHSLDLGKAYVSDLNLLSVCQMIQLLGLTASPPFALRRKKNYGNVEAEEYMLGGSDNLLLEVLRVLRDDGSFVVEIGGAWMQVTLPVPFITMNC